MKFLISEGGGIINWNGDVNSLDTGVYYLVKKVETIRVIGGSARTSKRREGVVAAASGAAIEEDNWRKSDVVDEAGESLAEIPNNDKRAGKIRYWQGLRYVEDANGKLERFPAGDEPQVIEGQMFSGYYSAGKFIWNYAVPQFAAEPTVEPTVEPEQKPKKKKKKVDEAPVEDIEELTALANELTSVTETVVEDATLVSDDTPFDEDAFLDDLSMNKTGDSCWLDSDKITLIVSFEGGKYKKRFKSDKVAASQLEVFKSLLIEDRNMAKELLIGSMSTFTKE